MIPPTVRTNLAGVFGWHHIAPAQPMELEVKS
jgi:hypothetical protein